MFWMILLYTLTAIAAVALVQTTGLGVVPASLTGFVISAATTSLAFALWQRADNRH